MHRLNSRLHRRKLQILFLNHPRGAFNNLASWQYTATNQSFYHRITDLKPPSGYLHCHGTGTCAAKLNPMSVTKTNNSRLPPTVTLTRGKSQTIQYGGDGRIVAYLGQL